ALNYATAERLLQDGSRVIGVLARDGLSHRTWDVGARFTINATGPWLGAANSGLPHPHLERRITAFSKGVHLVTRPLLADAAVAVATHHRSQASIQRGGRHFFIIPWRGQSLIGTTNVPFDGDIEAVGATPSDVRTFLDDINAALPGAGLSEDAVRYAFAGLYPLTETDIRPDVYQGTGHYQLVDHAPSGLAGYATALGAKYTTARLLAERAVDLALRGMGRPHIPSTTRAEPLSGRRVHDARAERSKAVASHRDLIDATVADHLYSQYGDDMAAVVTLGQNTPNGLALLADARHDIEATVRFAVRHEMAVTLPDVIFRRTGLGTIGHPGLGCLERCAQIMAEELGWPADRAASEVERTANAFSCA
ncbi:MAG: glycerol-3-phosphate dehydrogenase C-terminal domain-containing protein, partial [Vicinamibacterales bacterium]